MLLGIVGDWTGQRYVKIVTLQLCADDFVGLCHMILIYCHDI